MHFLNLLNGTGSQKHIIKPEFRSSSKCNSIKMEVWLTFWFCTRICMLNLQCNATVKTMHCDSSLKKLLCFLQRAAPMNGFKRPLEVNFLIHIGTRCADNKLQKISTVNWELHLNSGISGLIFFHKYLKNTTKSKNIF